MLLSSNYVFLTPKPLLQVCIFVSFLLFICCLIVLMPLLQSYAKYFFKFYHLYRASFIILCNEPTNTQLIDKLLYCSYMFRHYCTIFRELVVSTLLSYISMPMHSLVIQFKISHIFFAVESQ